MEKRQVPFNPAGLYSLVASYFAEPGTSIRTEQHNPVFEDVAAAMSQVLVRDGRAPMTGPLNMNGFAINNVVAGNTAGSVATLAQAMPIGAVIDFAGPTAPTGWALLYGQAISRAVYANLFALIGTTYGAGDGSTTFNLPNVRGCVIAGRDDMGGVASGRLTAAYLSGDPKTLGAFGGAQSIPISQSNLPNVNFTVNIPSGQGSHNHGVTGGIYGGTGFAKFQTDASGGAAVTNTTLVSVSGGTLPAMSGTAASGGSGTETNNLQPTLIMNKIMRVSYDG